MNFLSFIYTTLLFIVCSYGIIFKQPILVHATLFVIIMFLTYGVVDVTTMEGNENEKLTIKLSGIGNIMKQLTPDYDTDNAVKPEVNTKTTPLWEDQHGQGGELDGATGSQIIKSTEIPSAHTTTPTTSPTSVSPFKDVAVNDTVTCATNDPMGFGSGAAYRYGGNNMIQYYPTPPIATTWNKDWSENIINIPDCSKATVGTPKILGTKPAAQCEIKIDGACKSYPNMSNRDWFADNDFGGPKPTTLESCKYRQQSWETSCSKSANVDAKYNQQLIPNSPD